MSAPQFLTLADRLARLPSANQGSGGEAAFFLACATAVKGHSLTEQKALEVMREWNAAKCLPPFSERDVVRKVKAATNASMPEGLYLPREPQEQDGTRKASKPVASVPLTPLKRQGYDTATLAERAAIQGVWPTFRPLTGKQIGTVAHWRDCPIPPVEILNQCERLAFDPARPDCFCLTDGRTDGRGHRQYRHLDGSPFPNGAKSINAKGSAAKGFFTLGPRRLDPDELVFITEGTISLLEAVACQHLCRGKARRWHLIAAHSCNSTFAAEPDLLKAIAGHHCRILPDPGKAGTDAARVWANELRAVGCRVDFATLPDGFQDLRKLLAAGPDGLDAIRSILTYPNNRKGGQV